MFKRDIFQHILFWIIYIMIWSAHDLVFHNDYIELFTGNLYNMLIFIPLVYFNLYYLIPQFLLKRKYTHYLLAIGMGIIVTTIVSSWNHGLFFTYLRVDIPTAEMFLSAQGKIIILTEILVLVGFTMTLYLLQEWYQKERYAREIEQRRLETELNLLKNQINPHFLFNSLNSIYLMLDKDYKTGRNMLLQFSDLLSHQLYETNKEKVSLKKEIENLENYIGIEKIRHHDLAKVNTSFPQNLNGQQIVPMLLLPIVENAFKHGQSSQGYWIDIDLKISKEDEIQFNVTNSCTNTKPKKGPNGIGLSNLNRRLELLYPGHYQLETQGENGVFQVNLNLQLND